MLSRVLYSLLSEIIHYFATGIGEFSRRRYTAAQSRQPRHMTSTGLETGSGTPSSCRQHALMGIPSSASIRCFALCPTLRWTPPCRSPRYRVPRSSERTMTMMKMVQSCPKHPASSRLLPQGRCLRNREARRRCGHQSSRPVPEPAPVCDDVLPTKNQ